MTTKGEAYLYLAASTPDFPRVSHLRINFYQYGWVTSLLNLILSRLLSVTAASLDANLPD